MPQPGQTSARGDDWLVRKVQDLERKVQELSSANVFGLTGITPQDGGTSFDGYVHVNGPMTVTGALTLPAGIIGNDALANAVTGLAVNGAADSFGLPGSSSPMAVVISKTVTVPAGFTQAQVLAYADLSAVNSGTAGDYAYVRVKIDGAGPAYLGSDYTQPGQSGYAGSSFARTLTGLSGSFAITVEVGANTSAWSANVINGALLSAMVTFLR